MIRLRFCILTRRPHQDRRYPRRHDQSLSIRCITSRCGRHRIRRTLYRRPYTWQVLVLPRHRSHIQTLLVTSFFLCAWYYSGAELPASFFLSYLLAWWSPSASVSEVVAPIPCLIVKTEEAYLLVFITAFLTEAVSAYLTSREIGRLQAAYYTCWYVNHLFRFACKRSIKIFDVELTSLLRGTHNNSVKFFLRCFIGEVYLYSQ